MAFVLADRVKETTSTSGTSDFVLSGAATGFQSFSAGVGANNTTYYAISDGSDWEIGLGTLSTNGLTLARTTVLQSSNSDTKVSFSSNSKQIFVTYPADKAVLTDATQTLTNKTLNSPTFVTPVLGTPSSGTVTNLTGTASININGTVGATTASTGAFTTLTTSSTVTHNGGTANGVTYLNGSKVLTSGSALTFDGTNLGVGGSSSYKLGVTGSSNNATSGAIQTVNSNAGTGTQTGLWASNGTQSAQFSLAGTGYTAYGAYAAGNAIIYNDQAITLMADNASTGVIKFAAGGNTEGMRLTSTGLGIGTSSPSEKLEVYGTTPIFQINDRGLYQAQFGLIGNDLEIRGSSGVIEFYNGAADGASSTLKATLDASGNLCVGSSSAGNAGTVNVSIGLAGTTAGGLQLWASPTQEHYIQWGDSTSGSATYAGAISYSHASNFMRFWTGSTERARIDSSGRLLVGTTDAAPRNFASGSGFRIGDGNFEAAFASGNYILNTTSASGTLIDFRVQAGTVGSITTNGTITVYNTTSDYRLKTVVGAVTGQGARIDALEPIEYTWNSNGTRTRGFIAHKFQEVYSNSVTGEKDAVDADGKPVYQAMQASSSEVIADLVAEIQSLRQRLSAANL